MKFVTVDSLREGDILARDVLLEDYTILLAKGTQIKEEYIQKMQDLSIGTVYIEENENTQQQDDSYIDLDAILGENPLEKKEEEKPQPSQKEKSKNKRSQRVPLEEIKILRDDVEEKIKNKVKDILELHVYQHTEGLEELAETAQNIITDILEEQEVLEKVYDIRERSADIYEHSMSTCTIATLIALKLKMPEKDVYDISISALIHDLGLRYLVVRYEDQDIHFLPFKDQEEYKKHTIYAYTAIKNETWISEEAKDIVLNHHEHIDGSGYPLGIDRMTRACQVLSVCDEFDEMICGIGKARVRVHEAINCIRNYSGIWYEDDIVSAFLQMIAVYPVGSKVITNTGEKAVVMKQNMHFPERPVLRVLENRFGEQVFEEKIIDLIKETSVVIQTVVK